MVLVFELTVNCPLTYDLFLFHPKLPSSDHRHLTSFLISRELLLCIVVNFLFLVKCMNFLKYDFVK